MIENTGYVDIRVVREWLTLKEYPTDTTCNMPLIAGYTEDRGVYLWCMDCDSKVTISDSTFNIMVAELKND
jgi:hypothetical protein